MAKGISFDPHDRWQMLGLAGSTFLAFRVFALTPLFKRAVLGSLVLALVTPVATLAQNRSKQEVEPEFKSVLTNALTIVRKFQSPDALLREWGDPAKISGVYTPELTYNAHAWGLGLSEIRLSYAPPAKAPYRLSLIRLQYRGVPKERDLVEWLGPTVRTKREDINKSSRDMGIDLKPSIVVSMEWSADRPGLGIRMISMYLSSRETVVYVEGQAGR